jgi:hypothetical protein
MEHACACFKSRVLGNFPIPPDVNAFMSTLNESSVSRVPYSKTEYWNLFLNETFPDFLARNALLRLGVPVWTNQDPPALLSSQNDAANSSRASIPSTGSYNIRMFGHNFAYEFRSTTVALLPSTCQMSLWISDSATKCKVSNGLPLDFEGVVSVNVQSSLSKLSLFLNLSQPFLDRSRFSGLACTGSMIETFSASRLGQVQYSGGARVRSSACESSLWVSDSSMRCRGMSGSALLVGGFVSVAKVASPSVSGVFSYSVHAVRSAEVASLGSGPGSAVIAASGALIVRVLGIGYSSVGLSQSARLRGSSCRQSLWLSDSDLRCRSAWGKDLSSYATEVVVSLAQQGCAMTKAISYGNVVPGTVSVDRVPTTGGSLVSVSGLNIGSFGTSARLQLQGTAFESSRWVSSTIMLGKCGYGYGSRLGVVFSAASLSVYKPELLNVLSPSPLALNPTTGPGRGGLIVTVLGRNFGSSLSQTPAQMKATLGGTDCSSSLTWISDSAATFIHPPGILPGLTVVMVTDPLLSGDLQNAFGFAKPVLTGISPAIQPTSGRSEITFYGLSFGGNPHDLARLKIGATACSSTTWLSDSSARCRIPSGVSNQLNAVYSIGNYITVLTRAFTYLSPAVGSVRPSYGNTRGGNVISITGNSFGHGVSCSCPRELPCFLAQKP